MRNASGKSKIFVQTLVLNIYSRSFKLDSDLNKDINANPISLFVKLINHYLQYSFLVVSETLYSFFAFYILQTEAALQRCF